MKKCLRQSCNKEFKPTKPKQIYCSTKCRTYAYRESKMPKNIVPINTKIKLTGEPIRQKGESALDYAARKNEWKINQAK